MNIDINKIVYAAWIEICVQNMASLIITRSGKFSSLATIFHQQIVGPIWRSPLVSALGMIHCKSTNVDVLDIFASDILCKATQDDSNKSSEPPSMKHKQSAQFITDLFTEPKVNTKKKEQSNAPIKMDDWCQNDIDEHIVACINCNNQNTFHEIVEHILETKRMPSDAVIIQILSYLCNDQDDSMAIITRLIDLCQEKNIAFYATNVEFVPFLSQYLWEKDQFNDALNSLNSIFATTNKTAKAQILRNYRQIIFNTVKNQDDSILEKVITYAQDIHTTHKNPILIIYIWSDCFFSDLFRNHKKADELFDVYEEVQQTVSRDIGWIVLTLLQQHNIDAIHRLIEKYLALDKKREVGVCLAALFDYHCKYE